MVSSGELNARVEAQKPICNEKSEKSNRKAAAKEKKKKKRGSKNGNSNSNSNSNTQEVIKPRALVEELKLFQNNQLLNQQDPMEKLQIQLSELAENEDFCPRRKLPSAPGTIETNASSKNDFPTENQRTIHPLNAIQQQQQQPLPLDDNLSTVKKGLLWQQQNYEKFHQRLFSRWKKRYFILTTDYLVCFKRTSSKVGRSEMGKFLYKISLGDVTKIEWLKPKKSDKGAIVLHIKGSFNLLLWLKENLEEWMFMLSESIERNRIRRSCILQNGSSTTNSATIDNVKEQEQLVKQEEANCGEDFYENTRIPAQVEKSANLASAQFELNNNNIITPLKPTNWMIENDSSIGSRSPKSDHAARSQTITKYRGSQKQDELGRGNVACEEQLPAAGSRKKSGDVRAKEGNFKETQEASPRASKTASRGRDQRTEKASDEPLGRLDAIEHELNIKTKSSRESTTDRKSSRGQESDCLSAQVKGVINETFTQLTADNKAKLEATENVGHSRSEDERSDLVKMRKANTCNSKSPAIGRQVMASSRNDEERLADDVNSQRPQVNLIRRDDSWQSLVSLTRVGQSRPSTANALQVAQRSLYAQHIMPDSGSSETDYALARHRMLSIESTVTPSRGPLMRQLSVQASSSSAVPSSSSERAKHFGASIKAPGSPAVVGLNHQQRLQHSLDAGNLFQHQPTPSYTQQKLLQLQLLHNSNHVDYIRSGGGAGEYSTGSIYGVSTRVDSGAASGIYGYSSMRSNLKSAASEFSFIRPSPSHHNQALFANNNINRAALVSPIQLQLQPQPMPPAEQRPPVTQQLITNSQLQCAPTRELPLKPSKRRQPADLDSSSKGNSLGASIACFFRRAFSRRSKRRKQRNQAKLAESCSSSLGAFEASEGMIQVAPSAFSTGSKSVDGRQQQLELSSSGARAKDVLVSEPIQLRPMIASPSLQQHQQQLGPGPGLISSSGSPLHKSNSISATMGLTGLLDSHSNGRLLYDNAQLLSNNNNNSHLRSPFLSRSNRLSTAFNSPAHQRILSGGRPGELPRPSSIYGQPSMTGSTAGLNSGSNNAPAGPFGQHRNSLHNHQFRAAAGQMNLQPQPQQPIELRRQLDVTREVAEEGAWSPPDACSPKDPLPPRVKQQQQQHPRRAVVSPMLQSPTMSAIYDNHPMIEQPTIYSHYDNNNHLNNSNHQFHRRELDEQRAQLLKHQPMPSRQNRPAAMVAPCTPGGHYLMEHARQSPLLARRQPQSPLVSHSTNSSQRAVVNIAGAPGINLEPALAASLLRGTNIDATYQSAGSIRAYTDLENSSSSGSKAFVVATRLSKSMNHSAALNNQQFTANFNSSSNDTNISTSSSSIRRSKYGGNNNYSNSNLQSSKEEEFSSTTGSHASSSSDRHSSKAPAALSLTSPSHDDQQSIGERSSSSTEQTSLRKHNQQSPRQRISNNRAKHRKQRRDNSSSSSTTTNDELNSSTSQSIGTLEKPDERNWITSKLVN